MQAKTLVRYGAPIAIVAGALMIITRPVILFATPTEIGDFTRFVVGTTHAVNSVVSILAFALLVIALVTLYDPGGEQRRRVRSSRLRSGGGGGARGPRGRGVRGLWGAARWGRRPPRT